MPENLPFHHRLTDKQSIIAAVKDINNKVNGTGLDFREDTDGFHQSLAWMNFNEPNMLIVLASFDFMYYHDLEIVFYGVSHSNISSGDSWWGHWTKDQLQFNEQDSPDGFEFRFNIGTHSDRQYIIKAKAFSYHFQQVSHKV